METKEKKVKIKIEHMGSIDDFIIQSKLKEDDVSEELEVTTYSQPKKRYVLECIKKNLTIREEQETKIHHYLQALKMMEPHVLIPKVHKIFTNDPDYLFIVKQFFGIVSLK